MAEKPSCEPLNFGNLLRRGRKEVGLSLRELGRKLGVSHAYLAQVEVGECGPLRVERWRDLLEVIPCLSLRDLIDADFLWRRDMLIAKLRDEGLL